MNIINRILRSRYYWLAPPLFWGLLLLLSLFWNWRHIDEHMASMAHERARIIFEMILTTKINSNVMISGMPEFAKHDGNIGYRVFSTKPENPNNIASPLEARALAGVRQEDDEYFELLPEDNGGTFHYIRPVMMEERCLACHKDLGYRVGDIRGGIHIMVPAEPIRAMQQEDLSDTFTYHLLAWLLLSLISILALRRMREQWTELQASIAEASAGRAFLANITNNMGAGCIVINEDDRIEFINAEGEHLLGWPIEEIVDQQHHLLFHHCHDTTADAPCPILQTLHDGERRTVNRDCFTTRDGREIPVEYTVVAQFSDEAIRAVVTFDDISARLQSERHLRESEARFRAINEAAMEAIIMIDDHGRIISCNPAAERIFGYSQLEMIGNDVHQLLTPERLREQANTGLERFRDEGVGEVLGQILQLRALRKDGHEFDIELSISAAEWSGRRYAVGIARDITARLEEEKRRSDLERQLNQTHKMEAVGQLAGGIAHEINTPIQYVGDNLRFLRDCWDDYSKLIERYRNLQEAAGQHPSLQPLIEQIEEQTEESDIEYLQEEIPNALDQSIAGTEQVARIVRAMKEFAHPSSKKMDPADLNKMINNTVTISKNEWKYVADTVTELDPDLPMVPCLADELSQVILNLIVNAAHAIEAAERDEKGRITITTGVVDAMAEIRVSDTGTGVPEAIRDKIFNPFFTTKEVGKGTGQGLAIAQDIVAGKHQGTLTLETVEGEGSTFIIRLPLTRQAPEESDD